MNHPEMLSQNTRRATGGKRPVTRALLTNDCKELGLLEPAVTPTDALTTTPRGTMGNRQAWLFALVLAGCTSMQNPGLMPDSGSMQADAGADAGVLEGLILASDSTEEASPANIYVARPDGSGKCYVTNDGNWNRNAGWSYDGTKIVWDVRNSTGGIWIMDANGDNKEALTPLPSWAYGPAFSPDGTRIAYSDYPAGNPGSNPLTGIEVYVMNSDGTNKVQLTTTTVDGTTKTGDVIRWSNRPAYSPDGTKIVYSSTQSGNSEIWVMNADGTIQTQLTDNTDPKGPDANFPSFSPDGTKIAFLCGFETLYGNICVMNADGSERTPLTFNPDDGLQMDEPSSDEPAWSPDGSSILFDSNQYDPTLGQRAAQTWVMDADGSHQRVLIPHLYGEGRNPWRNDPVRAGGASFQCNGGPTPDGSAR